MVISNELTEKPNKNYFQLCAQVTCVPVQYAHVCERVRVSVCVNVQYTAPEVFLFTVAASAVASLFNFFLLLLLTNHIWRLFHVLCQNFVCECSRNQAKQNAN